MIKFNQAISLEGANVQENIDVPAGAVGVILFKSSQFVHIALQQPEEMRGIIVRAPVSELKLMEELDSKDREEISLSPHKHLGKEMLGDDPVTLLTEAANDLDKAGLSDLACETRLLIGGKDGGTN